MEKLEKITKSQLIHSKKEIVFFYYITMCITFHTNFEKAENSQRTVIMGSQSNLISEDILLSPAFADSPIEIQEYIENNLKLSSILLTEDKIMINIQLLCSPKNYLYMLKTLTLNNYQSVINL